MNTEKMEAMDSDAIELKMDEMKRAMAVASAASAAAALGAAEAAGVGPAFSPVVEAVAAAAGDKEDDNFPPPPPTGVPPCQPGVMTSFRPHEQASYALLFMNVLTIVFPPFDRVVIRRCDFLARNQRGSRLNE